MSYIGTPPFGQTLVTNTEKIATQDQVDFYPDGGYIPGYMTVKVNGSELQSYDIIATDGLKVTLKQKCGAGDDVKLSAQWPVSLIDTFRKSEIWAAIGDMTSSVGGRNRIVNGAMNVAQRGTSTAVTGGGQRNFSVDCFPVYSPTNACTVSQSTLAPAGFTKSVQFTVGTGASPAAGDFPLLVQRIEGINTADLNWGTSFASPVTLSFWVRSSVAGTYGVTFLNDGQDRRYTASFTINSANTWEYKTLVIPGDQSGTWKTDKEVGIGIYWDMGCGSTYSAAADGTWNTTTRYGLTGGVKLTATTGATFNMTGVQLEAGTVATPFERRSFQQELALCQRYYARYTMAQGTYQYVASGMASGSTNCRFFIQYPVQMRAVPSIGNGGNIYADGTSFSQITSLTIAYATNQCARINGTTSGVTAGQGFFLCNDQAYASYVDFSAEL